MHFKIQRVAPFVYSLVCFVCCFFFSTSQLFDYNVPYFIMLFVVQCEYFVALHELQVRVQLN